MFMKKYREDLEYFLKDRIYIIALICVVIIGYGYSITNFTVSTDDIYGERYVGSGNNMLAAGRFGMVFWSKIFGYGSEWIYNSFAIDIIAVILFMWAVVNYCILFRRIAKEKMNRTAYLVFSCILVSYSLINEIWEYTTANLSVCAGYFCVSMVLLIIWEQLHSKLQIWRMLAAVFLLMLVSASYESLVVVYVFLVFALLALESLCTEETVNLRDGIRQGSIYAGALLSGIFLRFIVHRLLLLIFHLQKTGNGATNIIWGSVKFGENLKHLAQDIVHQYIGKGILYLPIAEFAICILIFFILSCLLFVKKRNWLGTVCAVGMLFSPLLLSILQGTCTPYRACQVFGVFVAFTLMLLVYLLQKENGNIRKRIYPIVVGFCSLLCIRQAVDLNYFLTLNHLRSEEEATVIRNISLELEENFDLGKPIVFTGRYELSEEILRAVSVPQDSFRWRLFSKFNSCLFGKSYEQIYENYYWFWRKIPTTNVNSVLSWAGDGNSQLEIAMPKLFQYYGFHYNVADYGEKMQKATQYIEENNIPGYPKSGYIVDMGEYIIVNF